MPPEQRHIHYSLVFGTSFAVRLGRDCEERDLPVNRNPPAVQSDCFQWAWAQHWLLYRLICPWFHGLWELAFSFHSWDYRAGQPASNKRIWEQLLFVITGSQRVFTVQKRKGHSVWLLGSRISMEMVLSSETVLHALASAMPKLQGMLWVLHLVSEEGMKALPGVRVDW